MKGKTKVLKDERITKESNKLSAKMFYVITVATLISLVIKIACGLPIEVYALELIALVASVLFVVVSEAVKGILLVREKDEAIRTMHEAVLSKAMMVSFWIIIVGEFLYLFLVKEYFFWVLSYFAIWFVPALVITIASVKNGWFVWGSKKREVEGKQDLKKRVIVGALFFGVFVGGSFLYKDGVFHAEGILWILGLAAMWGVPFYFCFAHMMDVAEKKADKNLIEKESESEE